MAFAHLHLHTEYSLLDGACRSKKLPALIKELAWTPAPSPTMACSMAWWILHRLPGCGRASGDRVRNVPVPQYG